MLFHPTASGSILSSPEINQAPPLSQMIVVIERTHLVQSMSPQSSRGVRQASATKKCFNEEVASMVEGSDEDGV